MVGFVLGHQPARIDPAANRVIRVAGHRSSVGMMPDSGPMTCVAVNTADADGRPTIIGEGPEHMQKNKQQREFQFVFGCEFFAVFFVILKCCIVQSTFLLVAPVPIGLYIFSTQGDSVSEDRFLRGALIDSLARVIDCLSV